MNNINVTKQTGGKMKVGTTLHKYVCYLKYMQSRWPTNSEKDIVNKLAAY